MVEDGRVLAFLTPIITGDTDVVVFREPLQKVMDLPDLRLLRAEDIGAFVGEDIADDGQRWLQPLPCLASDSFW